MQAPRPPTAPPGRRPARSARPARAWALATSLLLGCSATTPQVAGGLTANPPPPAAASADGSRSLARLLGLIGEARCTGDAECRVLGVGARSCGGPERYVAWSAASTDGAALERVARQHADERLAWQLKLGLMSTCEVTPEPGARCEKASAPSGRCVIDARPSSLR